MSEPKNRPNRAQAWLLLWLTTGLGCGPTDNVVGAIRGGQLAGVTAGGGGEVAGGGSGNSQGGTAGSVPPGRSGAGGVGGSLQANAGAAGLGGPFAGSGGVVSPGTITDSSFRPVIGYTTGTGPRALALGDVDANGQLDLVVASTDDANVSVLLRDAEGFGNQVDYTLAARPGWVALHDLNYDGTLDLAVASIDSSSVKVLLGMGDGTFAPVVESPSTRSVLSLVLGDVNNDGNWDAVTAPNGDISPPRPGESSFVSVFLGDGSGKFDEPQLVAEGEECPSVALGDANHDGKLDLARLNAKRATVSVLFGNGDGTFADSQEYATGAAPAFVTFADLDGDGELDLLTADSASNEVSILLGLSGGAFAERVAYRTGASPQHVSVTDLNGDHHPDLITANASDFGVSVLQGIGDGTFAGKVDFSAAANPSDQPAPRASAVADFDGDGRPDFAVATARQSGGLPSGVLIFEAISSQ